MNHTDEILIIKVITVSGESITSEYRANYIRSDNTVQTFINLIGKLNLGIIVRAETPEGLLVVESCNMGHAYPSHKASSIQISLYADQGDVNLRTRLDHPIATTPSERAEDLLLCFCRWHEAAGYISPYVYKYDDKVMLHQRECSIHFKE
jgi:hypothetical protein